ncbi:hypothetical protein VA249_45320 (plasmid) [Vibrio alfacsensis]|uniref:hypothetical protein n=1 Tax=Vibrio alfacsensis TaxID=1074311 RepID=UPI001BEE1DF0|nr:hypothetical protein [Vibrio alfacsensis]BBM67886.1 hypothetical protein VA249_45320 [Vibrio alfacsensis]
MYIINFESRSPYRFVGYFRSPKPTAEHFCSYFSVEVEVAQNEWGTLLDNEIRYSIEVCEIGMPEIRKWYTQVSREYCVSGDNFVSCIGKILVDHNVIQSGVPFQVNIELNNKLHSFIQMNAGSVHAGQCQRLDTTLQLLDELSDVPVNTNDEIEEDWHVFSKGTDRFEIWKWFEENTGYPINFLLANLPKMHF